MNIVIKGSTVKENQALEDYALKKSERFYHYYPEIVKIEIELRSEIGRKNKDEDFIADILVKVPGHTFKVSDQEFDMYKAIDRSVKRMIEVLRREKEKHQKQDAKHVRRSLVYRLGFGDALHAINKRIFRRS